MTKWAAITDDFPGSSPGALWPSGYGDTPTVASNKLTYAATATLSGRGSSPYDLIDSFVLVKFDPASGGGYTGFSIKTGATDIASVFVSPTAGTMKMEYYDHLGDSYDEKVISSVGLSVWVRYRSTGSVFYGEYSLNGLTWTVLLAKVQPSALTAGLGSSFVFLETGPNPDAMVGATSFSKLNLPPGGGQRSGRLGARIARDPRQRNRSGGPIPYRNPATEAKR